MQLNQSKDLLLARCRCIRIDIFNNYRLRDLGLVTLKFRRLREDMISLYKISNRKAGMKEALGMGDRQVLTRFHQFPIFNENQQNKYEGIF